MKNIRNTIACLVMLLLSLAVHAAEPVTPIKQAFEFAAQDMINFANGNDLIAQQLEFEAVKTTPELAKGLREGAGKLRARATAYRDAAAYLRSPQVLPPEERTPPAAPASEPAPAPNNGT